MLQFGTMVKDTSREEDLSGSYLDSRPSWDAGLEPPLHPKTWRKPGDRVGNLILIRRDMRPGLKRNYSNGYWIARCPGGFSVRIHTQDIIRRSMKLQGCGGSDGRCKVCAPPQRLRRQLGFPSRPGALWRVGQTYSRLTVLEWIDKLGWLCECECGEFEYVERSRMLESRGRKPCPHAGG